MKTGEKSAEKRFLGYEFSNRRGSEGIHPIQRSKSIDECTHLYDADSFTNPEKASTYIYKAFKGEFDIELPENLQQNLSYQSLMDMLTFDRADFIKNISLSAKKKIRIKSRWESKRFDEIADIVRGVTYSKNDQSDIETNNIILTADNITLRGDFEINKMIYLYEDYQISDEKKLTKNDIFICFSSGSKEHLGKVAFIEKNTHYYAGGFMGIIRVKNNNEPKYFYQLLNTLLRQSIRDIGSGSNINNLSGVINEIKIPLPPLDIQHKIVSEIKVIDKQEQKAIEEIEKYEEEIKTSLSFLYSNSKKFIRLSDDTFEVKIGKRVLKRELKDKGKYPVYSANVFQPFGYIDKELLSDFTSPSVVWGIDGDWIVNVIPANTPFYPTDHCGYIRVLNPIIEVEYLAFALKKEGKEMEFSRSKRASIDRIQGIRIPLPPIEKQKKIVAEIEKIEAKIAVLESQIVEAPKQKEAILRKYLE